MREHIGLFRGKRIDNGEWVEGNLWIDPDLERTDISYFTYYYSENGLERDYCVEMVDPETVGECTGLRDKNGKLIFEGDIVPFKTKTCTFKPLYVEWHEQTCQFVVTTQDGTRAYPMDKSWEYEIIGNIHDNPELLKEGADNG